VPIVSACMRRSRSSTNIPSGSEPGVQPNNRRPQSSAVRPNAPAVCITGPTVAVTDVYLFVTVA
jgi:hypothetical protein